ncbi:MAG: hypothetical protein R3C49_00890 [Planctomycetaceae bacterium]
MSRRTNRRKNKKKKPCSESDRRYAARQETLRKIPIRHEGMNDSVGAKLCRRQAMSVLMGITRGLPDGLLLLLQKNSNLRYAFENLYACELFTFLGRPLWKFFPHVFPLAEVRREGLVITWSGMRTAMTDRGRVFLPSTKEAVLPVMYRGIGFEAQFTRHAIDRIRERCHIDPLSWHAHDRTFMRIHLQTGALVPWERNGQLIGFTLWDATPGDPRADFAIQPRDIDESLPFVDPRRPPTFELWRLIGYLPCRISGCTAVAKTLLYPGMRGTPEQKCGLEATVTQLNAAEIARLPPDQQVDVLKRLHAATPQFRKFTADEAKAAGNILMQDVRTGKRNRFVQRRFATILNQMEQSMILKRSA